MNNEENIELLDLDDNASLDVLPDATPLVSPRPRRPWLLLVLGLVVIVLATYIIIRTINGDSSSSMQVDLDGPVVTAPVPDGVTPPAPPAPMPDTIVVPPMPTPPAPPAPVANNEQGGSPVRVVADRRDDVVFNPDKATAAPAPKPVATPKPAPAAKPAAKPAKKPAAAPAQKPAKSVAAGGWYVQFGSYGTREAADAAGRQIRAEHPNLFAGHQFVVLAAQVQGTTKYRLRVAFASSNDANSFCRNAKSDGLDCYVAK